MSVKSGQKTVTTAGTAEALGSGPVNSPLMVKALESNTGYIYLGNDGADDVDSTNGMILAAGDAVIFAHASNLSSLILDAEIDGEGVSWTTNIF